MRRRPAASWHAATPKPCSAFNALDSHQLLMANSSLLRPCATNAASQRGIRPRPLQVSPLGPRYLAAAGLADGLAVVETALRALPLPVSRSFTVIPNAVIL